MRNGLEWVPVFGISVGLIVMIVIAVILIAGLVALSIYGKKLQARQEETQKELENASQSISMLVIDKKRMKLNEAGLPQAVLEQMPKYMRGRKAPIVKAKIGPRILSLLCDDKIFEVIPVRKEVRAVISGIYIMDVRGIRSGLEVRQAKPKLTERLQRKMDTLKSEADGQKSKEKKK